MDVLVDGSRLRTAGVLKERKKETLVSDWHQASRQLTAP